MKFHIKDRRNKIIFESDCYLDICKCMRTNDLAYTSHRSNGDLLSSKPRTGKPSCHVMRLAKEPQLRSRERVNSFLEGNVSFVDFRSQMLNETRSFDLPEFEIEVSANGK